MTGDIVLTGVTGSLGGHLARSLLEATDSTVHCLIRAPEDEAAARRLRKRLKEVGGCAGPDRLVAVAADLRREQLGLAPRRYEELVERTVAVYHCAAHVHLTAPYRQLAPVNIGGTRNLLGFAATAADRRGDPVGFHHVSSASVFMSARRAGVPHVDETSKPTVRTGKPLGYGQTKAAAERELDGAQKRGVHSSIYRPAVVTGHSRTGSTSGSDVLAPLIRAVAALGAAPEGVGPFPVEAVDEVTRQLVTLSTVPCAAGEVFHLFRPDPLPLSRVVSALRRTGVEMRSVGREEWLRMADDHRQHPHVLPLHGLGEAGRRLLGIGAERESPALHSGKTWTALERAGHHAAALDDAYLYRLVRALLAS
ncbi:SDR family oxidoreductase [Streptomyces cacaoi]|uniref:SDR family oxidoreductase n=1 Tax=Streptomyces cacaoi TaxID=1898 RepID=UPI00260587CB|nr:SDR family oxidoreductase [Streptomyces cacaoi]